MGIILNAVIATLIITIVGGGGFYLLWLKTRPKKETWNAKIYQLGEGVRPYKRDKDKNIISKIKIKDLRPFAKDILEKIEKAPGIVIHRLQRMNKITPAVEGDCVDYWGQGQKEISILLHKGECTILKKGYNATLGQAVFDPLAQSRINTIKGEMAIRKDRLFKEKDILQAITPWIVTGICMLTLIAMCYISIEGYMTISENLKEATENMLRIEELTVNTDRYIQNLRTGVTPTQHDLGQQLAQNAT